jgi:hypothetical protein
MVVEDTKSGSGVRKSDQIKKTSGVLVALSREPLSQRKGRHCYKDYKERVMSM